MSVRSPLPKGVPAAKPSRTKVSCGTSESTSLPAKIKDPTGIAGSWSESRSAEEIIATIHESRNSRR